MNIALNDQLDFQKLQGFRLHQFAVLNWGTFDSKVWQLNANQHNSLLTGNIGSGKSTLVDGLTTLLVSTRKLAFNKAAGAEEKERSLESYFHGYYTSQQDEEGKARAKGLRKGDHYSVLLAEFYSEDVQEAVSLAQVFWLKPTEKKVRRLFVVARGSLEIATDFAGFGNQINQLKKRLRTNQQIELFDTFPPYSQAFSKLLGLGADGKALELFNQTISMKSVGSVTDFVRQNMLEQPDVEAKLQELENNYDDLKRLHDAVVAARQKVELLTPIDLYGKQEQEASEQKNHIEHCRELTDAFMASKAITLYKQRIAKQQQEHQRLTIQCEDLGQKKSALAINIGQIKEDIRNNGGGRLQQLATDIQQLEKIRDDSRKLHNNYLSMVNALSLAADLSPETFVANQSAAKDQLEDLVAQQECLDQQEFEQKQQAQQLTQQQTEIGRQLQALKQRKSNIHLTQLNIREALCEHLAVDESRLPFVGELIQVKAEQNHWQGAVERVLHNFALSMMVPNDLYSQVCEFVENTHLGTRLVYYRIREEQTFLPSSANDGSLLNKIEIKRDSEHYAWLHQELHKRFDYHCCDQLEDFRRSEKAITRQGQIKSGKFRHEKDDRHNIQDKSRYVLGWNNTDKIQLLAAGYEKLSLQISQCQNSLNSLKQEKSQLTEKGRQAKNLAEFSFSFEQINWAQYSQQITSKRQEKQQLEQSSDVLKALQEKLEQHTNEHKTSEDDWQQCISDKAKVEQAQEADQQSLSEYQQTLEQVTEDKHVACFPTLDEFYQSYFADTQLRINMLANITRDLRVKLNEKIQHLEEKRSKKQAQMITAMGNFANAFPNDVTDVDRSPQALPEYQAMLSKLVEEDLPRHEEKFKEMLNRDTIRAMALFRSYLDKQEEDIEARIRLINQSLHELDYQGGTYIEIDNIASPDVEVRDFKQRLKNCVEFSTDDSLYSEEKFGRVKDLIEQMRNEPKWTKKVVDVRYWNLFNVIERYREDNSEKECYSDSGGKSGGQKEKLAYSILAAAILLQYGLVNNNSNRRNKRHFNLVVIDEAFARGSKDSTRFGLELFKKLGLQLLLVTPLQKLDVIEHYVQHVHFVDQKNNRSIMLNMTIEEYRQNLDNYQRLQPYQHMVKQA